MIQINHRKRNNVSDNRHCHPILFRNKKDENLKIA
jgi:hypothetical protein